MNCLFDSGKFGLRYPSWVPGKRQIGDIAALVRFPRDVDTDKEEPVIVPMVAAEVSAAESFLKRLLK